MLICYMLTENTKFVAKENRRTHTRKHHEDVKE